MTDKINLDMNHNKCNKVDLILLTPFGKTRHIITENKKQFNRI